MQLKRSNATMMLPGSTKYTDKEALFKDITISLKEYHKLCDIEAAAKNLVTQKGRYNTEIAYKKLEEVLKRVL
jgi:hypothetical protein